MNTIRTALALITVAAASLAQAQEATPMPPTQGSTVERAAVAAEAQRLVASDRMVWGTEGSPRIETGNSQRNRAAVQDEAVAARPMSAEDLLQRRLMYGM